MSTHCSGIRSFTARAAKAGSTIRRARSPVTPNSTKIVGGMPRPYAERRSAADLVRALLAQGAQMYRGPGAERPPALGDLRDRSPVALGDLVVEPAFVGRQAVRGVRATEDHQLRGERAETLDLLHGRDGLLGLDGPERCAVEPSVERGLGDGVQVLGLAPGQVEVEGPQCVRGRERAVVAVAADH